MKRFKQLELVITRLKRAVVDLTLDNQILREAAEETSEPPNPVAAGAQSMSERSSVSRSVELAEHSISPCPRNGMNPCQPKTNTSSSTTSCLECEPQESGEDLAMGEAESARQATQKSKTVAQ